MAIITVQNVPDGLKKSFKEVCAKNSKSMASVLVRLMAGYIIDNMEGTDVEEVETKQELEEECGILGDT